MDVDFDLSEVAAACNAFDKALTQSTHHAVETATRAGVNEARTRHKYRDRTGRLTGTNVEASSVVIRLSDGAVGEIVWPMPYASYVERSRFGGFAGVAYIKAEAVLNAESEAGVVLAASYTIAK
jgi:hypothetical protein